jgi:hypothetical protein
MTMSANEALFFGGFVTVCTIAGLLAFLWAMRKIRSRPLNLRQKIVYQWNTIDTSDSKNAAYKMSELGRFFKEESKEMKTLFDRLDDELVQYKYAKKVAPLSEETLQFYQKISRSLT